MKNKTMHVWAENADADTLRITEQLARRYTPTMEDNSQEGSRYLIRNLVPASDTQLLSGHGLVVETNKGTLYDFGSMSLNCILGQNDPWVNANLVSYILSGSPSYASTSAGTKLYYELAEKIATLSGIPNAVVNHRQCNGSDVAELAIVAAYKRRKPQQRYVVSFNGSYHGQNLTSFMVSDLQRENKFFMDDEVSTVFLDTPTHTQPEVEDAPLSNNDRSILDRLREVGENAFAVIIEPIQVNNRVNIASRTFLRELKKVCEALDIPLIFDDIQTGYGWLGTFSSATFFGVVPDMMAVSKALTAGYGPLAALVLNPKYDTLPPSTVRKTNGADMRSLVAAKAVIERMAGVDPSLIPDDIDEDLKVELRDGLFASHKGKSERIKNHLVELRNEFPELLGEIRGSGLIWCIDIIDKDGVRDNTTCKRIQKALLEEGVFVRDLNGAFLFKIPFVFTPQELQQGFDVVRRYLATES